MKWNRNIKIFINYVLGPLLFLWLSYSLYTQVKKQPDLLQPWDQIKRTKPASVITYTGIVFLLMLFNWLIEAWKWKLAINKVQPIGLFKAFKAVLSGVSVSATTPNRVGEYAGRVLFLDEGNRLRSVSLTIVCSISQLIITLGMGCLGLLLLQQKISGNPIITTDNNPIWVKIVFYGSLAVLLVVVLLYFRLSVLIKLAEKIPWLNKNLYLVSDLENTPARFLLRLLLLSFARFVVFCLQYYLLFRLFNVQVEWWPCFWVLCIVFLILAVIPTFAIAELGIRGQVTWRLMQLFAMNALGVTLAVAMIWIINLLLPAIAGSILIAGVRLFKNKKESN